MIRDLQHLDFARPWALLLLAIPAALALWRWARKGHPLVLPFDHGRQKKGRWLARMVNLANLLPYALLGVAILLIAGPRKPAPPEKERVMSNILFCVDVSESMTPLYASTVEAVRKFTRYEGRKGDSFGITFFGADVLHWVPPTKDLEAISLAPEFVTPLNVPGWFGGTKIGHALLACKDELVKQKEGDRLIILLTDGISNDLAKNSGAIIKELKNAGVVVDMVSVKGGLVNAATRISMETGGYAMSTDNESIETILEHVDSLHKAEFKDRDVAPMDFHEPFLVLGSVLLILQLAVLFGLRYTPW